ncbi:MAG: 50S ribosomal protein L11 methyltransferase [Muribaculaceae bacterium]|nr:50S ribosomal protein L11 methyltransferase [Muribaculaceae bacterium]
MTDYKALRLDCTPCSEDITDLLAALLADIGFESFVPDASGLTAYVQENLYSPEALSCALEDFPIECSITTSVSKVEGKNWNEEWEKNYFKPIVVGGDVVIHSSFHTDVPQARYDIVVDPKMAFGTGHHYTTRLMLTSLLDMELTGKSVIDMGTGTGILAILCAMRGTHPVTGIEIDPGAWENAVENVALNRVEATMLLGDADSLEQLGPADVFLANINRNIILSDLHAYADALNPGGRMLLSGFYRADADIIISEAQKYGLIPSGIRSDNDWTVVSLSK